MRGIGTPRMRMRTRFRELRAWHAGAIVCLWAMAGIVSAATDAPGAQQELQPQLDEMLAAANAHDTDRFMAVYARQPEPVLTFDDMTLRGWQVIRDQQLQWWDHGKSDAVYRSVSPPQVTPISEDVAATLQTLQVSSTTPAGTKAIMRVVATSIWKKLPEGWRIVVAHESMVPEAAPAKAAAEEP